MTIASEILNISRNANDADARAQEVMTAIDQDWEREATLYTFSDESVLVQSGAQLNAFESMTAARAALTLDEELPAMTPDPAYAAQIKGLREMTNAINSGLLPSTTPDGVTVVTEGRHIGSVVRMEGDYAIQEVGRGDEVAHPLSRFEVPPEVGKKMDVSYVDGLARVAKALSQDEHAVSVSVNTR